MMGLEDSNPFYAQILSGYGRNSDGDFAGDKALTAAVRRGEITVTELADEIMRLVEQDVSIGVIPWDVPDWQTMHDFCDANEYLLEAIGCDLSQEGTDVANAITDELNRRLAGHPDGNPAAVTGNDDFEWWHVERYSACQQARKDHGWPYRAEWV